MTYAKSKSTLHTGGQTSAIRSKPCETQYYQPFARYHTRQLLTFTCVQRKYYTKSRYQNVSSSITKMPFDLFILIILFIHDKFFNNLLPRQFHFEEVYAIGAVEIDCNMIGT